MYNSQVSGNVNANLRAVSKKITVEQNAKVFVGAVDMYNQSKINGNLNIKAAGNTGRIRAGKKSTILVSSLQMNGSSINGNGKFNLNSKVGNITLGKGVWAGLGSASITNSSVGGPVNVTSNVHLQNLRLGKDASFAAGTVGLNNANIGGGLDFTSNISVSGNVDLASGADVDLGSLQIM